MAKQNGLSQALIVEGYELTGDVGAINAFNLTNDQIQQPGIAVSSMERLRGRRHCDIDFLSYFNDAAGQNAPVLSALLTDRSQKHINWCLTRARGGPAYGFISRVVAPYNRSHGADGSFTGGTQAVSDGVVGEDLVNLTAPTDTHASASTSASVDGGAQTTAGAIGYCQVLAIGSGTPSFVMQDSANDSTFGTLMSFGAQAVNTGQRVTAAGTVERYTRAQTTGTHTDSEFYMGLRRGTAQDPAA